MLPWVILGVVGYFLVRQGQQTSAAVQEAANASAEAAHAGASAAQSIQQTAASVQPLIANASQASAEVQQAAAIFAQQAQALGLSPQETQQAYLQGMTPSQFLAQAQGAAAGLLSQFSQG
jgi:ABC-type transporter Mla subunit MlaD